MSNPFGPNQPGAPPPPPNWGPPSGAPPQGGWQQPGPYAPPPPKMSSGKKWLIGCLVSFVVIVGCCTGCVLWSFGKAKGYSLGPIQAQATAFGAGDLAGGCRHNAPALRAQMDCNTYVAWINANTPFFVGATVSPSSVHFENDARGAHVVLRVTAQGPRGSGTLMFSTVDVGGEWMIDAVRP